MAFTKHGWHISESGTDDEAGPEPADCGGRYFCNDCFDDVQAWRRENVLSINNPNSGEGWYEFIHPSNATTHIAYVRENGEIYLPEAGVTEEDLTLAAAREQVHRLVRADDVDTL